MESATFYEITLIFEIAISYVALQLHNESVDFLWFLRPYTLTRDKVLDEQDLFTAIKRVVLVLCITVIAGIFIVTCCSFQGNASQK